MNRLTLAATGFPRIVATTLLLIALAVSPLSPAQTSPLPPQPPGTHPQAREAINLAVAAHGGADNLRKSENATLVAEHVSSTAQSDLRIEYKVTLRTESRGNIRIEKDVWGEKQVLVTTPDDAWTEVRGRVTDLPAATANLMRLERLQRGLLTRYEELGYYAVMAAPLEDNGRTLEHVVFRQKKGVERRKKPGDEFHYYLHPDNHQVVRVEFLVPDSFGGPDFRLQLRLSEYRQVQGVSYAAVIEQLRDGKPLAEIKIRSARFAEKHDPALFRRPKPSD